MTERWEAGRWGAELAGVLTDVAARMARLADAVATDWPDRAGREWGEQVGRLHHDLLRVAAAAEGHGRAEPGGPLPVHPVPRGAGRTGVRLGDTAGSRVDDQTGVRIAELPG